MEEKLSKNKIKWINSLKLKKNRIDSAFFIIEGEKMTTEMLENWSDFIEFIVTTENNLEHQTLTIFQVDNLTMKKISSLSTPSHTLIVAKKPIQNFPEDGLFLLLDTVQDPGNMGTIIRTADWFGVSGIICSKGCVDIFNAKVIQSTMGSIFRVPIKYEDFSTLLPTVKEPIYGALLDGENIYETSLNDSKSYLMMGNEGVGITPSYEKYISKKITIPQFGQAESLNVAIATGIMLSEFKRG